ncbi:MAG: DNA primase [Neisseriaceae bacterium]|nr:DNA primase [Neisseriaceae bacterium]
MAIPQDFVDDLLEKVDIVDIIEEFVPLKKGGANYLACCPFHQEKTPSFTVSPAKQFFHCFGCGEHGTAVGFLMKYANLSFVEAVENLANRIGVSVPHTGRQVSAEERQAKQQRRLNLQEIMSECEAFYRRKLNAFVVAQEYVKNRGLDAQTIEKYGIGYAPDNYQALQEIFDDYPNENLITAGMVIENEGRFYDRFRHRIMFPIRDGQGKTIAFGGRILDKKGDAKYLNSPETPLFNKGSCLYGLYEARSAIRQEQKALVVEGYMDVTALSQYGIGYAVAALGTAATAEHIKLLFRETSRVYFCFDGDNAGRKAAWRALENALPQLADDKSIAFLFLPPEHDPDSFVREYGADYFSGCLKKDSIALSDYWLDELVKQVGDINSDEKKSQIIRLAKQHLPQMSDKARSLKFLMTKKLAEKIAMEVADLDYLIGQDIAPKKKSYKKAVLPKSAYRPKISTTAQKMVRWLLMNPQWAKYVRLPEYWILPEEYAVLQNIATMINTLKLNNMAQILERLRGSEYETVLHHSLLAVEHGEDWSNPTEDDERAFQDGMRKLMDDIRNTQIKELSEVSQYRALSKAEQELLTHLLMER